MIVDFLDPSNPTKTVDPSVQTSPAAGRTLVFLKKLPTCIQMAVTLIIATPFEGQTPFVFPSTIHLAWSLSTMFFGMLLCQVGIHSKWMLLLVPSSWIFTLHGARLLRLTLQHAAAHNALYENRIINQFIGELSSILTFSKDFRSYQRGHLNTHHNAQKLMTPGDETYDFWTQELCLVPGSSASDSWAQVRNSLISPKYHFKQILRRFVDCLASPSTNHNMWSNLFWGSVITIVTHTNTWLLFIIGWVFPILVMFEICSVLRQLVEHRISTPQDQRMTSAIWLADVPPSTSINDVHVFYQF